MSLFCFIVFAVNASGQLPVCSGPGSGLIYYMAGSIETSSIYNYDPTQPISSSNPSVNTIALPAGAIGLAVSNNLNAPSPSPTFYTIVAGNYYYYNGHGWTNTGHNAGPNMNIGGAGPYIYSMNQGGSVYKYDGTDSATFLADVPPPSGIIADITGDDSGNYYLFNPQKTQWLKEFNSRGILINTWTMSGSTSSSSGGGFAYIGNKVYYENSSGFWNGTLTGNNISFSLITSKLHITPSDFATCPLSPLGSKDAYLDTIIRQ